MNPTEHRTFKRIPFDAKARLSGDGGRWETQLIDISLKGVLVEQPPKWEAAVGDTIHTEITLADDAVIHMDARVAHAENGRVGLRCEHIDVDGISHLCRIVELNTGDPELLHRELEALGKVGD